MKVKDIISHLEAWAPKTLIDSWDNTGFQVGREEDKVENILVALDLDKNTLEKAKENNTDLIITHHPLIFKPLNKILSSDPTGSIVLDLIKNNIAVYNAHSNLDLAIGGVSDQLAKRLNMMNVENLRQVTIIEDNENSNLYGYGRIGDMETTILEDFIKILKSSLDLDKLIIYDNKLKKTIGKVAVCGGSGSDFIADACALGADVYITGDIKYHEAQYAYERGLTLIDIGHFHSEKFIVPAIKSYILEEFKSLNVETIELSGLPKIIL